MDVLIVEDVAQDAKLLAHLVKGLDLQVKVTHNANEAIQFIKEVPHIKVVLMNMTMPEEDGRDATRKIRQMLYNPVPVVGLSSDISEEQIERAMQSGMNSFLPKPYTLGNLYTMLVKLGLKVQTKPS
jgi:CheY-like chemotaxis protein